MDIQAVSQARARLVKAQKALSAFTAATELAEAEEAWADFLHAASTIYSKLEQGAKSDGKSAAWFGRKRKERKDDPLLRYLHAARNSDEHGIERVTATTPNNTWQGRQLKFNERLPMKLQMKPVGSDEWGEPHDAILAGPTLKPIRAHDRRYNDFCDPPTTHMGEVIPLCDFVDGLARVAIAYFDSLVSEAERLAGRSSAIAK